MSIRPVIVFIATFVANVLLNCLWDHAGVSVHSDPRAIFDFSFLVLLPFTMYLVGLYLTAALAEWHRVLRALALCGISIVATFVAVPVALVLALVAHAELGSDRSPSKPNHAMQTDSAITSRCQTGGGWLEAGDGGRQAPAFLQGGRSFGELATKVRMARHRLSQV